MAVGKRPLPRAAPMPERNETLLQAVTDARGVWLAVLGSIAAVFALRYAQEFIVPVALAAFLSYALEPVVRRLTEWSVPRSLAAALVLLGVVGALGFGIYSLTDDALAVADDLPRAVRRVRQAWQQRDAPDSPIETVQELATEIEKGTAAAAGDAPAPAGVVRVQVEDKALDVRTVVWQGSIGAVSLGTSAVLLVFLTYFCMASGDLFKRKIMTIAGPSLSQKRTTVQVLDEISGQVQRFLFIQLVAGTVVALLSWLAFRWLGLDHAAVWGLAAGLVNTIPYFGPVIVMSGLAIAAVLQFGTLQMVLYLAGTALLITGIEGFVLTPWLVGRAAKMNEVAVFVSLLFWAWMWGVVGMLLAVPIMMAFKAVCDRVDSLRPIGELLGD